MVDLVKKFKTNAVLDALKYGDIKTLKLSDAFGIMGEVYRSFGQLIFGKYRLILQCDALNAIHIEGTSEEGKRAYVENHLSEIYQTGIYVHSDYVCVLNVAPECKNIDPRWYYDLNENLCTQMNIFMPVIQKFVVQALTDTMEIKTMKE